MSLHRVMKPQQAAGAADHTPGASPGRKGPDSRTWNSWIPGPGKGPENPGERVLWDHPRQPPYFSDKDG